MARRRGVGAKALLFLIMIVTFMEVVPGTQVAHALPCVCPRALRVLDRCGREECACCVLCAFVVRLCTLCCVMCAVCCVMCVMCAVCCVLFAACCVLRCAVLAVLCLLCCAVLCCAVLAVVVSITRS